MSVVTKNLVFYHMPKTGGSFVEKTIEELGLPKSRSPIGQHFAPIDDHNMWHKKRYSFTVVRHPIHWMRSVFGYMRMDNDAHGLLGRCAVLGHCMHVEAFDGPMLDADGGFKRFVRKYLDTMAGCVTVLYGDYVRDCDFVGKTESIRTDLKKALTDAGEKFDPLVVDIMPYINANSRDEAMLYRWDIEILEEFVQAERRVFEQWYPEFLDHFTMNKSIEEIEKVAC